MVFKFIFAVCGMNCGTEGIRKSTGFEKGSPLFQKKKKNTSYLTFYYLGS